MLLLHTSDWHLGRSFHGTGMEAAQRRFIDELVRTVRDLSVDVVLIAGDVYDRAMPGVDVVTLFDDALVRLRAAGAQVVVTSGNHDSAIRLGFGARLLAAGGVHVRTEVERVGEPVVFDGGDHHVAIYPVPYLEPRMVRHALGVEDLGHQPVMDAALAAVRADVAERRKHASVPTLAVVMAHVFASGAEPSDSERELSIGGVDSVAVSTFTDFDYAALGHLHGRQTLDHRVRYSGSPIAYSFSEEHHRKGAWLVATGPDGVSSIDPVEWTPERRLATLVADLDDLESSPEYDDAESAYCQITVTDPERPPKALERLRQRFPYLLKLAFEPRGRRADAATYASRVAAAHDPAQVTGDFVEHVRQRRLNAAEEREMRQAFAAVREEETSR
ncbi:exonuclease SbcCD subunit D [Zhihengliuella flava]|uniref:Nuclease SbcCD subunit D n=1 Tax=Zhihengliuella flava TaxID=1285193 RepID=A0A931DBD0_9MICC|nr:exonuclease SbcCD subunit D [Zhihengliuella flava]MBG6083610.1 exonuclease SbcD [Zhihengliuella flava]